jgi:hypothetical protein
MTVEDFGQQSLSSQSGEEKITPLSAESPPPPLSSWEMAQRIVATIFFVGGFIGFWYGMAVGVNHHPPAHGIEDGDLGLVWSDSPGWRFAQYAWCGLLTWMLVRSLGRGLLVDAWAVARRLTFPILIQNVLVIGVTAAVGLSLRHFFPTLDRSWLYLLPGFHGGASNLSVLPLHIKYFGIAFLLLFAVSIPKWARSEEKSYREGTRNWRQGIWRSIRFGLSHCVGGVPLYAGLALTIGGLWFTLQYFRGGTEHSTLHHAAYNWIITLAALAAVTLWSFH